MTFKRILILDGYVDEPSTLGVPPTLSPYSRYFFGASRQAFQDIGIKGNIRYLTIGQYRDSVKMEGRQKGGSEGQEAPGLLETDILVLVNNTPVPGNYLAGRPASKRELQKLADLGNARGSLVISWKTPLENAVNLEKDGDAFLYDILTGQESGDRFRTLDEWDRWSVKGAELLRHHPHFPNRLISEVDTIKGCVRYINGGCTFCPDPLEVFRMRPMESVLKEISALVSHGGNHIRLGGSCIFSFQAKGIGMTDRPSPDPDTITHLFHGIRKLLPADGIFHTDNANAGIMAEYPEASKTIVKALVKYGSPGNSLSLGLESADPLVIERNHLNADPEEVRQAVRMINAIGRERGESGMPKLLPGLNLLYGLPGEREETHEHNFAFLKGLRKEGQLFRRINIRQLSPVRIKGPKRNRKFRRWKEEIRRYIDIPNLMDILPVGTVLRNVHVEVHDGHVSFGRQVGTYPIVVGIPFRIESGDVVDVRITDHGQRSVTGIPVPFDLNKASLRALSSLPGVGEKRAARIARHRPIDSYRKLKDVLGDENTARRVSEFMEFLE